LGTKIKALLRFYTLEDSASVQRPGIDAFRAGANSGGTIPDSLFTLTFQKPNRPGR